MSTSITWSNNRTHIGSKYSIFRCLFMLLFAFVPEQSLIKVSWPSRVPEREGGVRNHTQPPSHAHTTDFPSLAIIRLISCLSDQLVDNIPGLSIEGALGLYRCSHWPELTCSQLPDWGSNTSPSLLSLLQYPHRPCVQERHAYWSFGKPSFRH